MRPGRTDVADTRRGGQWAVNRPELRERLRISGTRLGGLIVGCVAVFGCAAAA